VYLLNGIFGAKALCEVFLNSGIHCTFVFLGGGEDYLLCIFARSLVVRLVISISENKAVRYFFFVCK